MNIKGLHEWCCVGVKGLKHTEWGPYGYSNVHKFTAVTVPLLHQW